MDNKIKKAITKAMAKLVGFSLNEKAMNGNALQIQLMGRFNHDIWIWDTETPDDPITMIEIPPSVNDVPEFEKKIEKAIAEFKAKFLDPKAAWIELNKEAS